MSQVNLIKKALPQKISKNRIKYKKNQKKMENQEKLTRKIKEKFNIIINLKFNFKILYFVG